MPDPRFFPPGPPLSLGELAALAGCEAPPAEVAERRFGSVAPLDQAGPDDLSFLDNAKYRAALATTRAGAVVLKAEEAERLPQGCVGLVAADPYRAYARMAAALFPPPAPHPGVDASAVVDPTARLGEGVEVGPLAVIGPEVEIGPHSRIGAGTVIARGVVIGAACRIGPQVTLMACRLGDKVVLHPGVRIGQDGFGFAMSAEGHLAVPQLGRVLVGDDVEIGANTTIDRGSGPDTVIGPGCRIDNLVQIGHNVSLGRGCVVVAQVGLSGSTRVGDFAVLGGQVGVAGHLSIGAGAQVAAQSGVMADIPPGVRVGGFPAQPLKEMWRQIAVLKRLARGSRDST
ncbi:UDP-3-O-(3-hydroxymyristoyl)glucosamine N-acyltransferase [Roseospirillum parvum]|uniref:UDP-3-O-acylglucosamine N-acyltransferase n=1 Tax=Roseospirillum parvum TaxID=83401 RepID=A0A1G7Y2X6_9PROT|nr:UDP-3-O-(3-hydroxymyristoyl)glucosamine N-acyltransferase [Roseospirillum parvum]SDG90771.1 UDP-3-O-[3-hydroxymyristoyl] glucosamine N-acyltransferase [Roseospirillum parvum]